MYLSSEKWLITEEVFEGQRKIGKNIAEKWKYQQNQGGYDLLIMETQQIPFPDPREIGKETVQHLSPPESMWAKL